MSQCVHSPIPVSHTPPTLEKNYYSRTKIVNFVNALAVRGNTHFFEDNLFVGIKVSRSIHALTYFNCP